MAGPTVPTCMTLAANVSESVLAVGTSGNAYLTQFPWEVLLLGLYAFGITVNFLLDTMSKSLFLLAVLYSIRCANRI